MTVTTFKNGLRIVTVDAPGSSGEWTYNHKTGVLSQYNDSGDRVVGATFELDGVPGYTDEKFDELLEEMLKNNIFPNRYND